MGNLKKSGQARRRCCWQMTHVTRVCVCTELSHDVACRRLRRDCPPGAAVRHNNARRAPGRRGSSGAGVPISSRLE